MTLDLVKKKVCCNCTGNHMTFDLVKNHALNLVIKRAQMDHMMKPNTKLHIFMFGV